MDNDIIVLVPVIIVLAVGFLVAYCASRKRKTIVVGEVLIEHFSMIPTVQAEYFISDADEKYRIRSRLLGLGDRHILTEDTLVKAGRLYEIVTYGWRIPFFGWYKKIVSIEEVSV